MKNSEDDMNDDYDERTGLLSLNEIAKAILQIVADEFQAFP